MDWTPELHRRFVQAVEQLGVDKAVPSRILELMGIECLTRHNVASHLQVINFTLSSIENFEKKKTFFLIIQLKISSAKFKSVYMCF